MKRFFLQVLVSSVVSLGSYFTVCADESGWEQRAGYKYQKMVVDGLQALQVSPSGDLLYTYNDDNTMRIWDFRSGKLVDSVVFSPRPDIVNFSKDGKTVVLAFFEGTYNDTLKQYLHVVDIASKKVIGQGSIDIFNTFNFRSISSGGFNGCYNFYDYASHRNELYVRTSINIRSLGDSYQKIGYLGVLEVKSNALVYKNQIDDLYAPDYLHYHDSIVFYSIYGAAATYRYLYDSMQQKLVSSWSLNALRKTNLTTRVESHLISNYESVDSNYTRTGNSGSIIEKVIPTNMDSILLLKSNRYYSYFDVYKDSLIKNRSIRSGALEDVTSNHDALVSYSGTMFYVYDIRTSALLDSMISPIAVTGFSITKSNNSIVAYNDRGEIINLNIKNYTSVRDEVSSLNENTVYPNPTTGIIMLQNPGFQSGQLRIDLVDVAGNTCAVLYDGIYHQEPLHFTLSDVVNGSYILRGVQGNSMKSFKVIKQ